MGKENGMERSMGAYLTVYLSLVMAVLLSLCLTLAEGVRRSALALEAECITDIGLNSVMAEYHRELFRQYNLFAVDSSYGTAMTGTANAERRLRNYLERNMSFEDIFLSDFLYGDFLGMSLADLDITGVSVLTDGKGAVFRRRAAEAVWDDINLTVFEELKEWLAVVERKGFAERNIHEEKDEIDRQIQEYNGTKVQGGDGEWITVNIENPTQALEESRKQGILKLLTEDGEALSARRINQNEMIAARMKQGQINMGNMSRKPGDEIPFSVTEGLMEDFLFREYLLRYMGHYGAEKEEGALWYQAEYLIAGNDSDIENLKSVVNGLLLLREAANALYLFSDERKSGEAEMVAVAIATLLTVPEIADLLKITILLGWAYAESLYDVKTMLAGGRIPLLKSADTWHFGLESALQSETTEGGPGEEQGLSYEDYLRIFLMMTENDSLTERAMNMAEADIRLTPGNEAFRLDGCYDGVEAEIYVGSKFGYTYEIVRQKWY